VARGADACTLGFARAADFAGAFLGAAVTLAGESLFAEIRGLLARFEDDVGSAWGGALGNGLLQSRF